MDPLKKQLKEMLVNDLKIQGVQPENISDTEPLFGDGLGLDSLDAVELVVLIKKYFGVQIADMNEGKKAFVSINSLAQYIEEHKG
ncbi:MAG: acyl carrier protein [Desulfuromonadales bacterium C00003093]|nr:MAG: acyl carrier protein [Desulfuromonadales bacterium C00003093]